MHPFTPQVWQAYPLAKGRQCFHGYKSANVSCTRTSTKDSGLGGSAARDPFYVLIICTNVVFWFFFVGGMRRVSPEPAFRTDYSFAGLLATFWSRDDNMVVTVLR